MSIAHRHKEFVSGKMTEYVLFSMPSVEEFDEMFEASKQVGLYGIAKTLYCAENPYYKRARADLERTKELRKIRIKEDRSK